MPEIKVEVSHDLGKEKAKEKLIPMIDKLIPKVAGLGAKLTNLKSGWEGDVMSMSGNVKKGFISLAISGKMEVLEASVIFTLDVAAVILKFIDESGIRKALTESVTEVLQVE